jgi:RimJ/RimL family protein N-acetyltransferase
MFSIIKKGIATLRSKGIKQTFYWFYFGYFKTNTFYLLKRELSEEIPIVDNPQNIVVKNVPIEILKEIRESKEKMPMEFYCDLFDGAKTCFIGFVNGQPAHISWVYFQEQLSNFFKLSEKEAELNYSITLPEFRGLSLFRLVTANIFQWLKQNNYERMFASPHSDNIASIKSLKRSGFKKYGEVRRGGFSRILGKNFSKTGHW